MTMEKLPKLRRLFNIFMLLHNDKYLSQNKRQEIAKHFTGRHETVLDRGVLAPMCHSSSYGI